MALTDIAIRNAKARPKPYKLADALGLFVLVQPSGGKAFGVHFALDGLLQMLPVEQRAIVARSVSVVGKVEWLGALEARRFAYDRAGINPSFAAPAILDACRLGHVAARAVLMRRSDDGRSDNWTQQEREWDVPVWFWDHFTEPGSSSQIWERGIFSGMRGSKMPAS